MAAATGRVAARRDAAHHVRMVRAFLHSVFVLAFASTVALGCGSGPDPAGDAGAGMDAGETPDGATLDADDDAGEPDGAARADGGGDAASDDDAGIDCSVIGCGAPVVCGEACDAPCGCCPCGDGEEIMRGGTSYVCTGGCYQQRGTGMSGSPCAMTADCGSGLSCCYPCGIPGCSNACEPSCAEGTPGCAGGCLARP